MSWAVSASGTPKFAAATIEGQINGQNPEDPTERAQMLAVGEVIAATLKACRPDDVGSVLAMAQGSRSYVRSIELGERVTYELSISISSG